MASDNVFLFSLILALALLTVHVQVFVPAHDPLTNTAARAWMCCHGNNATYVEKEKLTVQLSFNKLYSLMLLILLT